MIEFRKVDKFGIKTRVFQCDTFVGTIYKTHNDPITIVYDMLFDEELTIPELEQILTKMKELQGENNERTSTKNSGGI